MHWLTRQWHQHPAPTAFLVLATVFGLLFALLTPPTQGPDETTHFYRAYELSEGRLITPRLEGGLGDYLPRAVQADTVQLFGDLPSHHDRKFDYHQLPHLLKSRLDDQDRVPVHFEGASVYSPAGYLPQIAAIWVAKVVWPSPTLMYYLGRLANLVVWVGIMYLALRLWPGNKWPLFALALIPMSLTQGGTFSPDATMNSLAFLVVSAALYAAVRRPRLNRLHVLLAFAAVMLLSLCKPIFFVFGLLALLLGARQLGSPRRAAVFAGGLLVAALTVTLLWNLPIRDNGDIIVGHYYPGLEVDKLAQLQHILHQPLSFLQVLGNTYLTEQYGNVALQSFFGRLGWWDVDLPLWLVVATSSLVGLAVVCRDAAESRFTRRQGFITAGIFVLGFLATNLILYLTLSKVGLDHVYGLQGRYFIALAPLLIPLCFGLLVVKDWRRLAPRLFPLGYAAILSSSLIVMVARYI